MEGGKRVLMLGLEPSLVDFHHFPGLDAGKVIEGLRAESEKLSALGYQVQTRLVDLGETAEAVVSRALTESEFDCVMIGAGIRTAPTHFLLFERLINVVHRHAPSARICFNTKPGDSADAVQRWV